MKKLNPFNLSLLFATDQGCRYLRETKVTDIYDGVTNNFHDDGLFSVATFGRVGTEERDSIFSYIRLNTTVIHPMIYDTLVRLKRLYKEIILGQTYAIFNEETKDFESSDMIEGDTGITFFIKHLPYIEPDKRKSRRRNLYIDIIEKYKKNCLMSNCLVIPAGFRDLHVDQEGVETQDEVNDLYRRLISIASSISLVGAKQNDPQIDQQRKNLQLTMFEIYTYFENMVEGKKGVIQSKWGGRRIVNGTRNVISSLETTAEVLHGPRAPTVDDIQVGLLQTLKGASPIAVFHLKDRFLNDIFTNASQPTTLINRKTLKLEDVQLDPYLWDKFGTTAGLEKMINGFFDDRVRNKPIVIDNHYLYLVYQKDDVFRIFRDINEFPSHLDKQYIHPMTYSEMYYLCNYEGWYKLRALVTRYPINNMYSIYPAKVYTKTTIPAYGVYELGDDWSTKIGFAREYPNIDINAAWHNTATPSFTRLGNLSADYAILNGDLVFTCE